MTQIQVDPLLQQKLGGMGQSLELCAPNGQVLGRYIPEVEYHKILYGSVIVPLTEEEIVRRRSESGGTTLEQIWKRVGRG